MVKKIIGIITILAFSYAAGSVYTAAQIPLAESVLRLHVVANSDDPCDQQLKLEVKDKIVALMGTELEQAHDRDEARQIAIANLPRIQATATDVIKAKGYNYPVQVTVGEYPFPTKSYGNITFPPGNYQAVRVVIGAGQGKNWWCVLFPPLCLVSSSDRGISLNSPREAKVSLKCLELIPKGMKIKQPLQRNR
jgi:stage II sporulation protein R